jgi:hypothetical protein
MERKSAPSATSCRQGVQVIKTTTAGTMTVIGAEIMKMVTVIETAAGATMAGRGRQGSSVVALALQTSAEMGAVTTGVRTGKTIGQTTGEAGMIVAAGVAVRCLSRCTGLRTGLGSNFFLVVR